MSYPAPLPLHPTGPSTFCIAGPPGPAPLCTLTHRNSGSRPPNVESRNLFVGYNANNNTYTK